MVKRKTKGKSLKYVDLKIFKCSSEAEFKYQLKNASSLLNRRKKKSLSSVENKSSIDDLTSSSNDLANDKKQFNLKTEKEKVTDMSVQVLSDVLLSYEHEENKNEKQNADLVVESFNKPESCSALTKSHFGSLSSDQKRGKVEGITKSLTKNHNVMSREIKTDLNIQSHGDSTVTRIIEGKSDKPKTFGRKQVNVVIPPIKKTIEAHVDELIGESVSDKLVDGTQTKDGFSTIDIDSDQHCSFSSDRDTHSTYSIGSFPSISSPVFTSSPVVLAEPECNDDTKTTIFIDTVNHDSINIQKNQEATVAHHKYGPVSHTPNRPVYAPKKVPTRTEISIQILADRDAEIKYYPPILTPDFDHSEDDIFVNENELESRNQTEVLGCSITPTSEIELNKQDASVTESRSTDIDIVITKLQNQGFLNDISNEIEKFINILMNKSLSEECFKECESNEGSLYYEPEVFENENDGSFVNTTNGLHNKSVTDTRGVSETESHMEALEQDKISKSSIDIDVNDDFSTISFVDSSDNTTDSLVQGITDIIQSSYPLNSSNKRQKHNSITDPDTSKLQDNNGEPVATKSAVHTPTSINNNNKNLDVSHKFSKALENAVSLTDHKHTVIKKTILVKDEASGKQVKHTVILDKYSKTDSSETDSAKGECLECEKAAKYKLL
ncbi:hypothetical protein CDIK_1100 [Cucumispora dikerogammari]|nr:hypothetical protein CDIK_1100 [Cucumispora dikerogammari]